MTTRLAFVACTAIALAVAPTAGIPLFGGADVAFAKSGGGGGGNGGGNGGGKAEKSGNGMSGNASAGRGQTKFNGGRGSESDSGGSRSAGGVQTQKADKIARAAKAPPTRNASIEDAVAKNQHGKIASTLKGGNAAHASLTAYANAAPNSRVGRIATYRAALLDQQAALEDPAYLEAQQAYLDALAGFAAEGATLSPEEALAALQALDADGAAFTEDDVYATLAELNPEATDEELAALYDDLDGIVAADNATLAVKETVDDALAAALPGVTLEQGSPAWEAFHDLLRLDQPLPEPNNADGAEEVVEEDELLDEIDEILAEDIVAAE